MSTNGNANGHSNGGVDVHHWKVGLINCERKYLTAETFGHKINATATGLKKKQTWLLEQDLKEDVVYIKSHMGCYISTDKYGEVTCNKDGVEEGPLENSEKFAIEYMKDGKCAFRNVAFGNYFGGKGDKLQCFSKTPTESESWTVQLATHPQVNIRNVIRKRYAVLCEDEIHCKEIVPWGEAGLIILHFGLDDGKYSLKTSDNRFLHRDGSLVDDLSADTKFTLEIRSGANNGLAFGDCKDYYLTALGSTATLKSGKNKSVGKDELFTLDESHPQVTIQSQNSKFVSVKQGVDLSANQSEECEKCIFQMEYDRPSGKWAFRTSSDNKYWSLESFGGIQAACMTKGSKSLFDVESNGDGTVCIKASNKNYLYNKQTGSILCNQENPDPKTKTFIIKMVNRPFIILKCDFGFVGKSEKTQKPEILCNKAGYGLTFIEPQDDGLYYLKASNNKYWTVADDNSILADGDTPTCKFLLEFRGQSMMSIQAPNGKYLKGEPNAFMAKGEEVDGSTLWEF